MADITFNGMTMEFSVVENMMDEELKASIEKVSATNTEQSFLEIYMQKHKEKYGKEFLQN